jgi:hypothetical protein
MNSLLFLSLGNSVLYYVLVVPMLFVSSWVSSYCVPVSSVSYVMLTIALFFLQLLGIVALIQCWAGDPLFN